MEITEGEWTFEKSDLTIRSDDFKNGSQMGDYKGIIIADLKPALGCDYSDNVDLEHTGRSHAVPQTLANAHLIAAAPEGDKLASAVLDASFDDYDDFLELKNLAKIFKAKAEGKDE